MKHKLLSIALAVLTLLPSMGVEAKKVHTIGDSTMDGYHGTGSDKMGWGGVLQQFLNGTDAQNQGITVNNRGKSGSSSRTFYTDTRYWATLATGGSDQMQAGDILIIQFAHNDENNKGMDAVELQAYNAAHGLAAVTDLRGTIPTTTYKEYLRRYINEAKAMGVKPILVSAMCRNYFNGTTIKASGRHNLKDGYSILTESGVVENQKLNPDDHSMDYSYQMEQVALEYSDVPYINMTEATANMFETLGSAYCNANIFNVGDGTHTGPMGATLVARCFAQTLVATAAAETNANRKAVLDELAQYVSLSSDITLSPETMDFGSAYVGASVVKNFNLAGFDITPAAGNYTVTASEGYEVSLDGESWSSSINPAYAGGSIFATIKVRGTAANGIMDGTLTATCGSLQSVATLTMTGILNTNGTESQVVWTMADGSATATTTGLLTAGEEVISGLILGSPVYQEIDGVKYRRYKTSEAWPDQMDEVTDRYIQFSAEVPEGQTFRFDGLSMDVVAVATNNLRCRIYYATRADFTDAVQVKEFTSMTSNVPNHVSVMPMINLTEGDHIYVRIYPWMQGASATSKYIALKDVTIHGYAEEIGTIVPETLTWNLKGNTEDFGTQVNLNGDGTTAPQYEYNGLTFVGEKQVKDPVVEYINSNYGFHTNGASNANQRYIKFTPAFNGTLSVTFKSNNSSSERIAYIGEDFITTNALASASSTAEANTVSADLTAETTYYVYASSGVSFYSLVYEPLIAPVNPEPEPTEPVTATWDFTALTTVSFQGNTGTIDSDIEGIRLDVDATNGKLAYNGSNSAQFNQGTIIRVPVISEEDVVTVKAFSGYQSRVDISGVTMTQQQEEHTATAAEVAAGYVEVTANASGYLLLISVVQHPGAAAPGDDNTVYTFGIGRTIETAYTSEAGNILAAGQEVLKGEAPAGVTITQITTCDYANANATLYHGATDMANTYTAANAWRNYLRAGSNAAVNGSYNEDFYAGFRVVIPDGKVLNVQSIFGDFIAQKNNCAFKFEVVKNGLVIYESASHEMRTIQTCGSANASQTINTAAIPALQNLNGTIEFRMPWWIASTAASAAILDFNISATIALGAADEASPVFTTQPTATSEVMVNNPVELTVAAEHYSSLTWYQASSATADPANDTELGAGTSYTFSNATPGIYYVYCRAYNEDATGEQYANSNMATITVQSLIYPLTVSWDFTQGTTQDYFTNGFTIQNTIGSVHSDIAGFDLYVDASHGKLSTSGRSSNAQFNAGTILRVPVGSTNDVVKLTLYNGSTATLGGEVVNTSAEFTHRVYRAEAEQGYVEIVSGGNYLVKIQAVLAGDNARDDRNATITYYDVDGTTVLGTQVLSAGATIGTYAYEANTPAGYTNNGWYDAIGAAFAASQVVAADMVLYPYVTKIKNGKYIIPAGNGRQLYNTLKNAPAGSTFYLADGTYDLGNACRTELKSDCVLEGESRAGTQIVNHPLAPGIQATSTIRITGDNVYIQHLTLRCDVSYSTSSTHGVGVALEVNGDKSICYDVDLQCNQDTYYSNGAATQRGYMKDCRIEGTVDFICGTGNIWFENTLLYTNQRYANGSFNNSADVIAAPSTAVATVYGYVFNNCSIDGHSTQADNYNLARGWQNSPAATWLNTTCIIAPSTRGYTTMTSGLTVRFHELNTHDNAGNTIMGHNLDDCGYAANSDAIYLENAGNYTYENVVMGSDNWDPEAIISVNNENMDATSLDASAGSATEVVKFMMNGQLFIRKNGIIYNALGQIVK